MEPQPDLAGDQFTRMRREIVAGLAQPQKTVACKYLYDERGSHLFERICDLPEYYPTRTEIAILRRHGDEMAAELGPGCLVLEYGSGSAVKTELLLSRLATPVAYVPIEISEDALLASLRRLRGRFPRLEVLPVCADYTEPLDLPHPRLEPRRRAAFFPGSTIGNFAPGAAQRFLRRIRRTVGRDGALLIGVDLRKDPAVLEAAYDDAAGVTAAFDLNLLRRLNRDLGADFVLDRFRHRAVWNDEHGRVEMHLESLVPQSVRVNGTRVEFRAGETIHTENSYKYTLEEFSALAAGCGWQVRSVWTDDARLFSVQYLGPAAR
ncbi:MAG: L-histidine N(alpha)-methyltransferase [Candidatus Krumholzibacteriia bacterium]